MTIPLILTSMLWDGVRLVAMGVVLWIMGLSLVVSQSVVSVEHTTSRATPSTTTESPHVVETAMLCLYQVPSYCSYAPPDT